MDKVKIECDLGRYRDHIISYGVESQLGILQEEMAELTKDISKHRRGILDLEDLAEEMADVLRVWLQVYSLIEGSVDQEYESKDIFKK